MSLNDITIMALDTRPRSRLYYYQGNFYYPLEGLKGDMIGKVKGAIRKWKKENAAMFAADRAHLDYKTLVQIFDEHYGDF